MPNSSSVANIVDTNVYFLCFNNYSKITNIVKTVCVINYRPQEQLRKGNVFTGVCQSFCSHEGEYLCMSRGWVCLRDGYLRGLGRSMCGQGVDMSGWELVCPGQGSYVRARVDMSR